MLLTKILAFLIAIFVLVTFHEFSHFWVARRLGIKTLRFSIGFGKPIFRWHGKDGTEYVIGWLPFGGYVKLLDELEAEVPADQLSFAFNRKPIWMRAAVVLAGPISNWLLALLLFWLVFMLGVQRAQPIIGAIEPNSIAARAQLHAGDRIVQIDKHTIRDWAQAMMAIIYRMGEKGSMTVVTQAPNAALKQPHQLMLENWQVNGLNPNPFTSLGIIPYEPPVPPVISQVLPNQPAALVGLQMGDRIIQLAGQPVSTWQQAVKWIQAHPEQTVKIVIQRNGKSIQKNLTIGQRPGVAWRGHKQGYIGAAAAPVVWPSNMLQKESYSPWQAWASAWEETWRFSSFNFIILGKMLLGQISMQGLGGPITIFSSAGQAFAQGLVIYLSFLGLLSLMLACVNILPLPGLDGGHLLFLVIEAIQRRPMSLAAQMLAWRIGLIILIFLTIQATWNDLMRWWLN